MRVLVTGSQGFIGTPLTAEIRRRWPDADVMPLGEPPEDDLLNPWTLERIATFDPEIIFHLAAMHFIPWCVEHPQATLEVNAVVTEELLRRTNARTFVLASSAAVYGLLALSSPRRFGEADELNPVDVYGLSKVWAEGALRLAEIRNPGRYVAARLFNVVGPGDQTPHLLPLIRAAAGGQARLDRIGLECRRDYIHVEDVATCLVSLSMMAPAGFSAVNVSTGVSHSGFDIADRYGVEVIDNPSARREGPRGDLCGDPNLLHSITGLAPTPRFEAA